MTGLSHLARVLVVEDEALISLDIETTLADAGVADVVTATSVDAAMLALDQFLFDGAVLDLHLGRSGWSYEVARRLQRIGVPFIFTSGTVDIADGFREVPLVTKPFSTDQLLSALLQVSADRETKAAQ